MIYLSGPMTGYEAFNYPAFTAACVTLRSAGHTVVSPHEEAPFEDGLMWNDYLRRDITVLLRCRAIALLPGWQASRGAQLELHVARSLGFDIYNVVDGRLERWEDTP